jgi:cyclopropane fatty-acyl-phospholipid synthase-like methyltransferase
MIFGEDYSKLYCKIHLDKDYSSEARQLASLLQKLNLTKDSKILDFGCGPGLHVKHLNSLGLDVSGYDPNINMIKIARESNPELSIKFSSDLSTVSQKFDFTYSLFDVFSYQTSENEISVFLNQIISHTKPGGFVLLDGWHLDGVIDNPATSRSKTFDFEGDEYSREVFVLDSTVENITQLKIVVSNNFNNKVVTSENHSLRAFSQKEVTQYLSKYSIEDVAFFDGSDFSKQLSSNSWRFSCLFQINP